MARGSFGNNFKSGWRLQVDWSSTVDEANNRSNVTVKTYLISQGSYYTISSGSSNSTRSTINGVGTSVSFNPTLRGNQKKLIQSNSAWVAHDSDGDKRVTIGAWADLNISLSGQYVGRVTIPDATVTLDNIARRSTFTMGETRIRTGATLKFKVNPASANFTHTLDITVGSKTIRRFTDVGNDVTFTPTQDERDSIYAQEMFKKEVKVNFMLYTYSGGTHLGTHTVEGLYLLTEYPPLFSNFTFKDINSTTTGITGNNQRLIQNESDLQIDIVKGSGQKYATVKEYEVTVAKETKLLQQEYYLPPLNMGKVNGSGNTIMKVTAIDSRGMRTTVSKSIEFIPYLKHSQLARVSRLGGYGRETNIEIRGQFSPLMINGVQKNSILSAQYRYYEAGTTASGWYNVLHPIVEGDNFRYPTQTADLDDEKQFVVEVRTKDSISNQYMYEEFDIRKGVAPFQLDMETGDIRQQGATIFTGANKVVNNAGSINIYKGSTGTGAGLRALRMGETSYISGANAFPTWAGSYAFFQGAKKGGAGGAEEDRFGDFFLWKDRTARNKELYLGNTEGSQVRSMDLFDTITESRDGDNGSFIRYASGIQICHSRIGLDRNTSALQTFSFEAPFIDSPFFVKVTHSAGTSRAYIQACTSMLESRGAYGWTCVVRDPTVDGQWSGAWAIAIGRWK